MTFFKHLNIEERIKIESYLEQGVSQAEIARKLGRSRFTISRELKRNKPDSTNGLVIAPYFGSSAQNLANIRRAEIGTKTKLSKYNKRLIEEHLRLKWSPEQIAYGLRKVNVSTNTIYNWIYKGLIDFSIKLLRHHGKRYRPHQSRYVKPDSKFIKVHSIENRPKEIESRSEFGHWEVDTVLSSRKSSYCLATFIERKTRFYYAIKMKKRNSAQFRMVMDTFMSNFGSAVKSITCDHGVEFVNRLAIGSIENAYNIKVYYAHAYAPHERGSNELHNYLLREYFPKKTNFNKTSAVEILTAIKDINDRPRKMHNWKSTNFKFQRELAKTY